MTSKFLRILLAGAMTFTLSALAQTGSAATPSSPSALPSAPGTTTPATPPPASGKVGTINIQDAIFGCNEGRRDMDALQKKYEPKQTELKSENDELEGLKKQLSTTQDKLNEESLANLKKQIEGKQKTFDRNVQDAQEEVGNQQQDIASRILSKMAPLVVKYAQENGFTLIVDTSKPWPQSPVLWWNPDAVDITKNVVEAYNVQSGVAAPAAASGGAAKPVVPRSSAGTKPSNGTGAAKPAAPKTETPKQ